jgi:adenylate cyclase
MTEESANQTTSGHVAFVSYASQDAAVANSIVKNLEQHGLKCWIAPRDVKPGAQYADAIVRAINEAKAVVLVMSAGAVGSAHVGKEIERASSKRKPIITFRIDGAPLNHALEYFLSESQWIDVPALGMPVALARLKEAVGQAPALVLQAAQPAGVVAKRFGVVAAILVALGVSVAAGLYYWWSNHNPAQPSTVAMADKSIAVLPFTDMSEKKDQEYFADGMAEEIIDLLATVPGLRVIGRTSSFQFKGKAEDLRSIAKQLGVAYVLEGSVRKSNDRMRVTAQLIDSRNGTPRWSQTYDRDFTDVLKLQDEIAIKVVREVESDAFLSELASRKTLRNPEAYTAFLQGVDASERGTQQAGELALSDFQRALDLDPSFAEAASALAGTYLFLGNFGLMPTAAAYEKARNAAELALKIDPNQYGAHSVLSRIHIEYDWDWPAAEREFKLAKAVAFQGLSSTEGDWPELSMTLGRWDDALAIVNKSVSTDPLDPNSYSWLGFVELRRGRLTEAEAAMRRALELNPTFPFGHYSLGLVLLARGEAEAALAENSKELSEPARLVGSAMAYFRLGRKSESDAALDLLLKNYAPYVPSGIAAAYAFRGESDEALNWLERAYAQRDSLLYRIKFTTEFDKLHDDPRYKAFLKKMNLPE